MVWVRMTAADPKETFAIMQDEHGSERTTIIAFAPKSAIRVKEIGKNRCMSMSGQCLDRQSFESVLSARNIKSSDLKRSPYGQKYERNI